MCEKAWKLSHDEKRWHISVSLETLTALHIGCNEVCTHDAIVNENHDNEPVEINACIKGHNNLPIIPGSTIKGKLYHWLKSKAIRTDLLDSLFGKGHSRIDNDQGRGGKAEFHDARITRSLSGDQHWPYWRENTQTYIEASTAIDRHRRTALPQSLHYTEMVPPGIQFQFVITGVMTDDETAFLIAALNNFGQTQHQSGFGTNSINDCGRIKLHALSQIKSMDAAEIVDWLTKFDQNEGTMAIKSATCLKQTAINHLLKQGINWLQPENNENRIQMTLQFGGPFLVNDPSIIQPRQNDQTERIHYYPLYDKNEKPLLPTRSIRGALRSQAERIIRTLGGFCCDTKNPCDPIHNIDDRNKLCLACQIFGAPGWKSLLTIHQFNCIEYRQEKNQDFVAIDRFHGGGKEGAKYSTRHIEQPMFKGVISFSSRMEKYQLTWGKGLLALVLRDLKEGDIFFGFGANKGYGRLETVSVDGFCQQATDINNFRDKCLESARPLHCNPIEKPEIKSTKKPLNAAQSNNKDFHNPFHFIPINQPDTSKWSDQSSLNANSCHSHGFYRQASDNGERLYHGRISCCLQTETPTFIGADKIEETEPAKINNYRLNGEIAIPATSLRGMISSLVEAASNSAMRVLDNSLLSYRKTAENALRKLGMVIEKKGQLYVIPLGDSQSIPSLKKTYPKSRNSDPEMESFIENKQSWSPQHNLVYYRPEESDARPNPIPQEHFSRGAQPGILRILGKTGRENALENKANELFIPISSEHIDTDTNSLNIKSFIESNSEQAKKIPDDVLTRYTELADQQSLSQKNNKELKEDRTCQSPQWLPYHLKGAERKYDSEKKICKLPIESYDLIYYNERNGKISEIAFSSIWRGRVENDAGHADKVYDFVSMQSKELLPFNKNRLKISPAELLFGFVEVNEKNGEQLTQDALAFAGKVRVGEGVMAENSSDDVLTEELPLKALLSPKPPSPAFYFKPKAGNHFIPKQKLKSEKHRIKGRKYYLHALRDDQGVQKLTAEGKPSDKGGKFPWITSDVAQNNQLKSAIKAIRTDQAFYFDLDFNNLNEWEVGLLCYALRPTESFRHRIGMGKSIGLGSVKIDILALQTIDRYQRYATDDMDAQRYNQHRWTNPVCQKYLDETDCRITPTDNPLIPCNLKEIFTRTMDDNVYRALDLLGDPKNISNPVHYPQVHNESIEDKNYQWFVANDQAPTQATLEDISKDTDHLPTLNRY